MNLRYRLILFLAGKDVIILNAKIKANKRLRAEPVTIKRVNGALICNNEFVGPIKLDITRTKK